jgi:AP-2 complex subunit alpha
VSLYKHNKELITGVQWAERINDLILHRTTGMQLSACSLLMQGLQTEDPSAYITCVPVLVRCLYSLAITRDSSPDYMYYSTPCPWLQVKLLKLL